MTHISIGNQVQNFYNLNPFPGPYTVEGFNYNNRYIELIQSYVESADTVLDIGCGTGLVTNSLATKNKKTTVTGIDFSENSINYAKKFAEENGINNVQFECCDLFDYRCTPCDIVICQSVLTHINEVNCAVKLIDSFVKPNGIVLVSVFHPWGKLLKKFVSIDYKNKRLKQDQEENPYENTISVDEICKLFFNYNVEEIMPSWHNRFVAVNALLNSRNGGLAMYAFRKKYER